MQSSSQVDNTVSPALKSATLLRESFIENLTIAEDEIEKRKHIRNNDDVDDYDDAQKSKKR